MVNIINKHLRSDKLRHPQFRNKSENPSGVKPPWIRVRYKNSENYLETHNIMKENNSEQNSSGENNELQQVLYYEIPVEYEIRGNFLSYLKFRRALSKSSKVINYDKEEITTLKEIQGQILSKGTISIVGLPNEYQ